MINCRVINIRSKTLGRPCSARTNQKVFFHMTRERQHQFYPAQGYKATILQLRAIKLLSLRDGRELCWILKRKLRQEKRQILSGQSRARFLFQKNIKKATFIIYTRKSGSLFNELNKVSGVLLFTMPICCRKKCCRFL